MANDGSSGGIRTPETFYTIDETAAILKVTRPTIYALEKQGLLVPLISKSGMKRFTWTQIVEFMNMR